MGLWGGVRRVTAAAVSCALLAQLITVAPAAAAPAPREIVEQRTAYSKVFDNGDGTFKFESYGEPIHYKDETTGRFEPIESDLVRSTDPAKQGWRNKANGFEVTLPERVGDDWVSIETGPKRVSFRPARSLVVLDEAVSVSATGVPDPVKPEKLTYASAFGPGVSLEYVSSSNGLKETIVLDKYRGKNIFAFELDCAGLNPKMMDDGGVGLYSSESTAPVYTIAPPFMEDSAHNDGDEPARSEDVSYLLMPSGATWTLTVVADAEWLTSPTRVWPVKIDPTFFTIGFGTTGDSFVTNAYPNSNYGTSTELKCGYYPGSGENYSYVMPDVGLLMDLRQYASVQIIDANMNMYCSHRYDYKSGPISYGPINAGWGEYSLTWNNQPYATYFGQGTAAYLQRTRFPVGTIVQSWMDTGIANGIAFWAPVGGQTTNWTKFASKEAGGPVFECAFTTRPKVIMTVASDTTSAGAPRLSWTRDDFMYTISGQPFVSPEQLSADFEIRKEGTTALLGPIPSLGGTATTYTPSIALDDGRYFVRMRITARISDTVTTTSDWTAWQPFEVRKLTLGSEGAGTEPYRASDSAGGATVDLATGRLLLSRTDFAASALGGPLGASFVYDSSVTTADPARDVGLGWRLSMPTLRFEDQKAPNDGFQTWSGTPLMPSGWTYVETSAGVSKETLAARVRTDAASMKICRSAVGNTQMRMVDAIDVYPGQNLDASAWVQTSGLTQGTGGGGFQVRIAYYDSYGNYTGYAASSVFTTPSSTTWRKVGMQAKAPDGTAYARMYVGQYNSSGTVWVDDARFGDGTMKLTDADGTARTLAQVGDGVYLRDPLAGTLALKRTNVARGIMPALAGTGGVTGASTDGSYAFTTGSGWDRVTITSTPGSLTYDLGQPRVLSEARLYLVDPGENTPRVHSYWLQYLNDEGEYENVPGLGQITDARGWQTHYFTPVRTKGFRIVASAATTGDFCLAELELPVTTISESPVCFDAEGKVTGIADTSANLISYSYDGDGDLISSADLEGRHLDLVWTDEQLTGVDFTGVGSESTDGVSEPGVVRYRREGDSLLAERKADDGTYVTMATYTYTDGRITSVTDADGINVEVAYDEEDRVETITRSSESTPTVTHYDYDVANQVTITTSGSTESVSRRVEFDPALGCQVTAVVADPGGEAITTTYAYDTYGHVKSVTDALGRVDTYACDAHGNVTQAVVNSETTTDDLKLTTSATYANDRVASATDVKGNQSFKRYDAKWRPISSTVAIANSTDAGVSSTEETYDEYGNVKYSELPGSSVANLLENGTFEEDPRVAGNGWTANGSVGWSTAPWQQPNLGYMLVTSITGTPWLASDRVAVTPGETYIASAWCKSGGRIGLSEYDAAGQWVRRITLATVPTTADSTLRPASAIYVPPAGIASVSVELGLDYTTTAFDNARFEKANAAGPDGFIDNDSVERVDAAGVPESWARYYGADDLADTIVAGTERVLRLYGGSGGTGTPWWESAPAPVTAGRSQRFTVSVASESLSQPSGGWAGVQVIFFPDYGCTWGTETRVNLTGSTSITGSTSWTPYSAVIQVPANAHWVKICPLIGTSTGAMYVDHLTMEPVVARETYTYDDGTHTYLTETTQLSGAKVGAEYDARGRTTEVTHTDPGSTTETVETERDYDTFDRLTSAETAPDSSLGITATFTYTAAGRLETVTDPLGEVTTVTYDEGRIASVESPSGITTAMTYDGLGRLKATTAPYRGGETPRTLLEYVYDGLGRVSATTFYAEDGSVAATQSVTYDDLSRPDTVTWSGPEAQGSLDYAYDALGRATGLTSTGPAGTVSFTATFDKASLPLTSTFTAFGLSGFTTTNTFAKTGQWQKTSTAGSQEWSFTFGTDGTFRRAASPLSSRGLLYNTALQLDRVRLATTSGLFTADEAITYDGYGRVAASVLSATGDALDASQAFTYDAAGRLETWTLDGATTRYTNDAAGNLTGIDRPGTGDDTTFTPGDDNQLASAVTAGVTTTYAHDDFGRRTSESSSAGETTFTWDSLGRLTGIASEDATSTYEYGPTGMRERITVVSAEATTTTECVWSGATLVASRVSETQGGTTTVTDYRYLYGPDSLPLEMIVTPLGGTPSAYTYQCDRAGSVIALTDATGAAVATYAYDPWGEVLEAPTTGVGARNPLRYRGYYFDTATGLYYLPARYYDPATARFLSPDPAAPSAGDPLSLNRYAYCVGDPVNADDPTGAVMVQGSGVTTPVSSDAVQFAKDRNLDAAKKTQAYFRDQLATCRPRYGFEGAIGMAEFNTDYFAFQLREDQAAIEADAEWDDVQDWLSGVSAAASLTGTACLAAGVISAPTVVGGGVGFGAAGVLFVVSAVTSGANCLITYMRAENGFIDRDEAAISYMLNGISMVPVIGDGAAVGGHCLEVRD